MTSSAPGGLAVGRRLSEPGQRSEQTTTRAIRRPAPPPAAPTRPLAKAIPDFWTEPSLLLVVLAGLFVSVVVFPVGFQGWDDLHYVQAAERWLAEGPQAGENHWATRLPYVLLLATSFALFGVREAALVPAHAALLVAVCLTLFALARPFVGRGAALWGTAAVLCTPLFLRSATTFYPEVLEAALGIASIALAMPTLTSGSRPHGNGRLLLAGLAGGTALVVRQTAVALPFALALFALFVPRNGRSVVARLGDVALLALGHTIPVAADIAFHYALTGDPLHRLAVDTRHVLIPSVALPGGIYEGRSPLFNFDLAARWQLPVVVDLHWSVNGLLRLFTHPALLLTPAIAVVGGVLACRMGGVARIYAGFAALVLTLQYAVNTFILVLPPNVRYFATALLLASPLAGLALAALPRRAATPAVLALLLPTVAVSAMQPRPATLLAVMEEFAHHTGSTLYISGYAHDAAYLALRGDTLPASAIRVGPPVPIGAFAMWNSIGWPAEMREERCEDGVPRWEVEAERPPPGLLGGVIKHVTLWALVPDQAARLLRQYDDATVLLRRRC